MYNPALIKTINSYGRIMKKLVLAGLVGLTGLMSFTINAAECNNHGCTGKPSELFSNYYQTGSSDGKVYLQLKSEFKSSLGCTLAEGHYITLLSSHPLFKEIYSTLLSASAMDRKVYIRTVDGSSICQVIYTRIYM